MKLPSPDVAYDTDTRQCWLKQVQCASWIPDITGSGYVRKTLPCPICTHMMDIVVARRHVAVVKAPDTELEDSSLVTIGPRGALLQFISNSTSEKAAKAASPQSGSAEDKSVQLVFAMCNCGCKHDGLPDGMQWPYGCGQAAMIQGPIEKDWKAAETGKLASQIREAGKWDKIRLWLRKKPWLAS